MSERLVQIDVGDSAPCNLRCVHSNGVYCTAYPGCAAGAVHKILDWFKPGPVDRRVIRIDRKRSRQGGYSTNRVLEDPTTGQVVEEVELHCKTLRFDALAPKAVPGEKSPPTEQPRDAA